MRILSQPFMDALTNGHLRPLVERITGKKGRNPDHDLDLFLRGHLSTTSTSKTPKGEYINIYFKGMSLLKLWGPAGKYKTEVHKKYRTDPMNPTKQLHVPVRLSDAKSVTEFLSLIPKLKDSIQRKGKPGELEAEVEQLIIRFNNTHGKRGVKTDYFILDRQYTLPPVKVPNLPGSNAKARRKNARPRVDLIAVRWPHRGRSQNRTVVPVLIELKYGLNESVVASDSQADRYMAGIAKIGTGNFQQELRGLLRQRAELGLFGDESNKLATLAGAFNFGNCQPLILVADYNPNSSLLTPTNPSALRQQGGIPIRECGFALWG